VVFHLSLPEVRQLGSVHLRPVALRKI